MPIAKCQNCGRITNSSVSNYWDDTESDGKTPKAMLVVTRCYAAFVDEQWVFGCGHNDADQMTKALIFNWLKGT